MQLAVAKSAPAVDSEILLFWSRPFGSWSSTTISCFGFCILHSAVDRALRVCRWPKSPQNFFKKKATGFFLASRPFRCPSHLWPQREKRRGPQKKNKTRCGRRQLSISAPPLFVVVAPLMPEKGPTDLSSFVKKKVFFLYIYMLRDISSFFGWRLFKRGNMHWEHGEAGASSGSARGPHRRCSTTRTTGTKKKKRTMTMRTMRTCPCST